MRALAIAACALAGVLVWSAATPRGGVAQAQAQELRISHSFPAQLDSRDRAARVFAAEVTKRAPYLNISVHPALSLGYTAVGQFDAMKRGELEMSVYPLTYASPQVPEFAIAWLPFIPADFEMAARLKGSAFHRKLQGFAESRGIHIVTWWWMPGGLATRQREIGGPPTVKDVSIRLGAPPFERLFVHAGARAAPFILGNELAAAVRDGKIDGVLSSIETLLSYRIHEHTKFATFGGVGSLMTLSPLVMSTSAWEGLTIDEKAAVEEAADVSDAYFESQQREIEQKAVAAFTKGGARIHRLTIDEYEAWSRIAKDTIWPEYRKISPEADGLFVALLSSIPQQGKAGKDAVPLSRPRAD